MTFLLEPFALINKMSFLFQWSIFMKLHFTIASCKDFKQHSMVVFSVVNVLFDGPSHLYSSYSNACPPPPPHKSNVP